MLAVSALDYARMGSLTAVTPWWHRPWLAPVLNLIIVSTPLLILGLALTLFFTGYGVAYLPLTHATDDLAAALLALAPTWTGAVTLAELQSFAPMLADGREKANYMAYWMKMGFAMWIAAVLLLYIIWIRACTVARS